VDGSRASVSLHGLLAGTAYHVRIVAVDCESRTRPSRWVTVETRAPTAAAAAASQRQQRDHQHGTCVDTTARPLHSTEYASEVTTLWRYTNLFITIIIIIIIILTPVLNSRGMKKLRCAI